MSFGKLNILHHKSWNVWNRDNVEKVLRDEREHRENEDKKRARVQETESELRVQHLRERKRAAEGAGIEGSSGRAAIVSGESEVKSSVLVQFVSPGGSEVVPAGGSGAEKPKGFNLFESLEGGIRDGAEVNTSASGSGGNKEFEREAAKEKERRDREFGLVSLGQDNMTGDSYASKPWYASKQDPSSATFKGFNQAATAYGAVPFGVAGGVRERDARDEGRKAHADPMRELGQYLGATREAKDKKKGRSSRDAGRHGKGEDKAAVMAKLRAERQAREASERARVQAIMGGGPPPEARRVSEVSEDPRSGYNSGFARFHGGLIRDRARDAQRGPPRWGDRR